VSKQRIGFGADLKKKDESGYLKMVTAEDLIQYGFESEFIGRLPVITVFDRLDVDDLYQILRNRNSTVTNGKKRDFKAYGIDLRFEEEALYKIAERAFSQNTGARGLVSVVEKVLMKFEKKLPSTDIKRLLVTEEMVENPVRALKVLLENVEDKELKARYHRVTRQEKVELKDYIKKQKKNFPEKYKMLLKGSRLNLIVERVIDTGIEMNIVLEEILSMNEAVREYEKMFFKESGITIMFEDSAVDQLMETALKEETPIDVLCSTILRNYHHGLKLIKERNGKGKFIITKEAIRNPERFLDGLIKTSYEK
jgi:ATP-dependent protease Clp ATPase subunit